MTRQIRFFEALREAQDQCMATDPSVLIMGLGVPDPKGIFGTTAGLQAKYGPERVMDMPLAENGMTGVAIGAALVGMRPILTHQRMDFAILSLEQLVNQAAKWHYMFGGQTRVPIVVRMIVGRGWGQGPQHSQSLHSWFGHIPGLKVILPTTPYDAKGLLVSAIEDDNPVIFVEHRWLYSIADEVPAVVYRVPLGKARIMHPGEDVTIVGSSYMALEALRAAESLASDGVGAEVIDLRSLRPLDEETIVESVRRTGRLVVADHSWRAFGTAAEIVALVTERAFSALKSAPVRVTLPDFPAPSSPALADSYYPRAPHIAAEVNRMLGRPVDPQSFANPSGRRLDQPDPTFTGPF